MSATKQEHYDTLTEPVKETIVRSWRIANCSQLRDLRKIWQKLKYVMYPKRVRAENARALRNCKFSHCSLKLSRRGSLGSTSPLPDALAVPELLHKKRRRRTRLRNRVRDRVAWCSNRLDQRAAARRENVSNE